jgi:hypothetical protein
MKASPSSKANSTTSANESKPFSLSSTLDFDFLNNDSTSSTQLSSSKGKVYLGLADIGTLQDAEQIHSKRGAEGTVFDPALIYLLACNYSIPLIPSLHSNQLEIPSEMSSPRSQDEAGEAGGSADGEEGTRQRTRSTDTANNAVKNSAILEDGKQSTERQRSIEPASKTNSTESVNLKRDNSATLSETVATETVLTTNIAADESYDYRLLCYQKAITACQHNFNISQIAGLACRASVWASLEALIPLPIKPIMDESKVMKDQLDQSCHGCDSAHPSSLNSAVNSFSSSFSTSNTYSSSASSVLSPLSLEDNNSEELPFTYDILSGLVLELLEGGDSQHFVVVCEILRCAGILATVFQKANISELRVRSIYISYIELLMKLKLFTVAISIIKSSNDEQIASLSKQNIEIKIKCSVCRKDLKRRSSISVKSSTVYCENCRRCVSNCSYCMKPVVGLLQWCPICSHGGHINCLKKWFQEFTCCPTGCGHQCCFSFYQVEKKLKKRGSSSSDKLEEERLSRGRERKLKIGEEEAMKEKSRERKEEPKDFKKSSFSSSAEEKEIKNKEKERKRREQEKEDLEEEMAERYVDIDVLLMKRKEKLQMVRYKQFERFFNQS